MPVHARNLALVLVIVSLAAPARGQRRFDPSTQAKAHYELGMTAYSVGHYDRAIEAFTRAYRVDPAPILLYNIAQAQRKKGDGGQAITYYRRYLDAAPGAEDREAVLARIRELEAAEPKLAEPKAAPGTGAVAPVAVGLASAGGPRPLAPGNPGAPVSTSPPQPGGIPLGPGAAAGSPADDPGDTRRTPDRLFETAAERPLHRQPWFWQVVGAAALVTAATIFLVRPDRPWSCGPPDCNLPTRTVD